MTGLGKFFIASTFALLTVTSLQGSTPYITVLKTGKVFDEPNSKGYVTLNTKNEEVVLQPGMVFKVVEDGTGWDIIEYSPGLRGYVSEQVTGKPVAQPKAGSYKVENNPVETLTVTSDGKTWKATVAGKSYNGTVRDNAVVFMDASGEQAYSLVVLPQGPVAMSYDEGVTRFF